MSTPRSLLLTDLYELTMLQGYHQTGLQDREACFDLFFRHHPFHGGYSVFAGLEDALRFLAEARFSPVDIEYLQSLGLFTPEFLSDLARFRFSGEVHAPPEGSLIFPLAPVLRVQGPLGECQLVESILLNIVNFQSLIATKAARICHEAGWDSVMEFGLRRAQGADGALTASRAAHIGGCAATSNLLAGRMFDIPVRGTHAHSWVMAFRDELEAFRAYACAYPTNAVLLVDTYDTLGSGVPNAIKVGLEMKARGEQLAGIRLDSGDLAYLSIEARRMLDEAGLEDVKIVASSDLDEYIIHDMKGQDARIDQYGVGTKLISAEGDPAFSGVYKIAALRDQAGFWESKVKLSEGTTKPTLPGVKQVWRLFEAGGEMMADWIEVATDPWLEGGDPGADSALPVPKGKGVGEVTRVRSPGRGSAGEQVRPGEGDHPAEPGRPGGKRPGDGLWGWNPMLLYQRKRYDGVVRAEPLLQPVFRQGRILVDLPPISEVRARVQEGLAHLHPTMRRLMNPHVYKVSIGPQLRELTVRLRTTNGP